MRLLIVRHGETQWNILKKTQGQSDTELSERGRKQARKLSFRLRNMRINEIYASPLERAAETAAIIAKYKKWPVIPDKRLIEIGFGQWEGMTFEQISQTYPDILEVWSTDPQKCVIPGGETLGDVVARIDAFLAELTGQNDKRTVMAVTHSVPSKLLVARAIGLPIENIHSLRIDNAALSIIDFYPERPILRLFNDCTHLQEGVTWQK